MAVNPNVLELAVAIRAADSPGLIWIAQLTAARNAIADDLFWWAIG